MDIPEDIKSEYLQEMKYQKSKFENSVVGTMIKSFTVYEEQLEKKKAELQIKQEVFSGINNSDQPVCGEGTILQNGVCVIDKTKFQSKDSQNKGGCLIATAAYGTELTPQVQKLRELRDDTLLQIESGKGFMTSFNQMYYSFSPAIADYERESPVFREMVKIAITPMITSLSILNYVDIDSEHKVLWYGLGILC